MEFENLLLKDNFKYVVYRLAHEQLPIHAARPAYMVLGFFSNKLTARIFANSINERANGTDFIGMCKVCKYIIIGKTIEHIQSPVYVQEKLEALNKCYEKYREFRDQEFAGNKNNKTTGLPGLSIKTRREARNWSALQESSFKRHKHRMKKAKAYWEPVSEEHPPDSSQKFALVVHLRDITEAVLDGEEQPEPAIMFVRSFSNVKTAKKWIKDIGSTWFSSVHLDLVDMNQWIYPEDIDEAAIETEYSHPKLTEFVSGRKETIKAVHAFEKRCGDEKLEVPEIVLDDSSFTVQNPPEE